MTEGIYHEASARGTIFRIETNGGGFAVLHEFTGGTADGERPFGSLLLVGSTIYGMTMHGGDQDLGRYSSWNKTARDSPCCTNSPAAITTGKPHMVP